MYIYILAFFFLHGINFSLQSMEQSSAIKRCEENMTLLKASHFRFDLAELQTFFPKFLIHLEEILAKLKTAKDPKDIVEYRKSCDAGCATARFLLEGFKNTEVKSENPTREQEPLHGNTPSSLNTYAHSHSHIHVHSHTHANKPTENPTKISQKSK